jgi:hypothetical protein
MDKWAKTLTQLYGGFRTANLLDNGSFEDYTTAGAVLTPISWGLAVSNPAGGTPFRGAWSCSTADQTDGLVSLCLSFNAARAGDYATIYQDIPLHAGAQAEQIKLRHHYQVKFRFDPEGRVPPDVPLDQTEVYVLIDLIKADGTIAGTGYSWLVAEGLYRFDVAWYELTKQLDLSAQWTAGELASAVSLRVRLNFIFGKGGTVVADGTMHFYVDDFWFDAEGQLSRPITFGDTQSRDSKTEYVRAGDALRTMRWRSEGEGRSKLAGTMPFNFNCLQAQRDMLLGMWCYSRRTYLLWWCTLPHYPSYLDIVFTGPFALDPANPNITTAGYKGSLKWEQH